MLSELGLLRSETRLSLNDNVYYKLVLQETINFGELSDSEKADMSQYVSKLADLDLKKLLGLAYSTKEFNQVQFGEEIVL